MRALKTLMVAVALTLAAVSGQAAAPDDFANHRVTLLVPFAAGGTLDILARLLAEKLGEAWGPRVVVENRPGAGGIIASRELLRSPPDGHTLMVVAGGHALNPMIYQQLPYDTLNDFTTIAQLAQSGNVILVPANSPHKSLADLLKAGKADPGSVNYGTAGLGTSVHLSGELLKYMTGVDLTPVHFKGDSESLAALIGSHIQMSVNSAPAAIAQTKQGTVRAVAVTSSTRSSYLPDVPTVAEAGVPGYEVNNWQGVIGPGKMPPEIRAFLNAAIQKAMKELASTEKLKNLSVDVTTGSSDDFDKLIRSEMEKWAPVVKAAGIRLDAK